MAPRAGGTSLREVPQVGASNSDLQTSMLFLSTRHVLKQSHQASEAPETTWTYVPIRVGISLQLLCQEVLHTIGTLWTP